MNLGEALTDTLARLREGGIEVGVYIDERDVVRRIEVLPLFECPTCRRLSPAEGCLWCDTEFHGEGVA
jgi:hypothetical protein